jgi:hypothetical protein
MKIWEEERRSCRGREKKRNVLLFSYFRDSGMFSLAFFINGFTDKHLNILFYFFSSVYQFVKFN